MVTVNVTLHHIFAAVSVAQIQRCLKQVTNLPNFNGFVHLTSGRHCKKSSIRLFK